MYDLSNCIKGFTNHFNVDKSLFQIFELNRKLLKLIELIQVFLPEMMLSPIL